MFDPKFLKDTAERAISTFAQSLLALVGTNAVEVVNISIIDSLVASGVAAALSVLKAVAAAKGPIGDTSASLINLKGD
jgi:hypothetical protein